MGVVMVMVMVMIEIEIEIRMGMVYYEQENGKTKNVDGMSFEGHWAAAGWSIATAFAMTPKKKDGEGRRLEFH